MKKKIYSGFKENVWGWGGGGADLADIFSEYAWVVPLKDKKGNSIVNAFQKILDKSIRKPNKIWVDKGNKFYSSSFKNG